MLPSNYYSAMVLMGIATSLCSNLVALGRLQMHQIPSQVRRSFVRYPSSRTTTVALLWPAKSGITHSGRLAAIPNRQWSGRTEDSDRESATTHQANSTATATVTSSHAEERAMIQSLQPKIGTSTTIPVEQQQQTARLEKETRWFRHIHQGIGDLFTAIGFLTSSTAALWSDPDSRAKYRPSVTALRNFLKVSGIDLELSKSLNSRLLNNIVILGRIQLSLMMDNGGGGGFYDRRNMASVAVNDPDTLPSLEDALRYARYATAAYGNSMIRAAQLNVHGKFHQNFFSIATRKCISGHVGVPEQDIVAMDVAYSGSSDHLRHFVAVDHKHRRVVLSIRGTFSLSELVVDAAGFTRVFCGGEAHCEMANMAERVWAVAGETVLQLLRANEGYELVLTGHSLGAGTACLLNILCHRNNRELVDGRTVHCFAYAPPPVFTPLEFCPQAVQACTSYIHGHDTVPFLSIDSVRHLFAAVRVVDQQGYTWLQRLRLVTGYDTVDSKVREEVSRATRRRLPPKAGAPLLEIPAAANVWIMKQEQQPDKVLESEDWYDAKVCDSSKLAELGILVHSKMMSDHLPSRYEHALHNLK